MSDKEIERRARVLGFKIAGTIAYLIAAPLVFFVIIGVLLDRKFGTLPWLTILGFILAGLASIRLVRSKAKELGREYEALFKNEKKSEHNGDVM